MKTKYLIGTAVGGLMEMPDWRFDPPFDIIEADSVKDAVREYNKKHNCSYFYGCPMCEITADGECVGIDVSTSRQMCEDILKDLIGKKNMIHDELVTYEVAKLAKEKGFDVPTDRYYHIYDNVIEAQNSLEMTSDGCADFYNSLNRCRCAAPTHSLLQRWLREEKNIHIAVFPNLRNSYEYDWIVYIKGEECWLPTYSALNDFPTYEQALEDALKYALEKLV